jgi:hypothetical protein
MATLGSLQLQTMSARAGSPPVGPFVEQAKLIASDREALDSFGQTISVSADGNTALVGDPNKTVGGRFSVGVVYVEVRSGSTWSEQAELSPAGPPGSFGTSVAISGDGNTALVGAPSASVVDPDYAGAAFVYTRSGTTWSQTAMIPPSDTTVLGFGRSVGLSADGTVALIGQNLSSLSAGKAAVFTLSAGIWSQAAEITPPSPAAHGFGSAVALSGDGSTGFVAAPDKTVAGAPSAGKVFVFTGSGATWSQEAGFSASDAGANDLFGRAMATSLDGSSLLVGAASNDVGDAADAGAVYAFTRSGGIWTEQQQVFPADTHSRDLFGSSISMSGDGSVAVVGAVGAPKDGKVLTGSAYVFSDDGSGWSQVSKVTPPDPEGYSHFGVAVGLSSDASTAMIGSDSATGDGPPAAGAAYAFIQVAIADTTTTISTPDDPVPIGVSARITATVYPIPDGGSVSFTADGASVSGCSGIGLDRWGRATCEVTYDQRGSHQIGASFSGSGAFTASDAAAFTLSVVKYQAVILTPQTGATFGPGDPVRVKFEVLQNGAPVSTAEAHTIVHGCLATVLAFGSVSCAEAYHQAQESFSLVIDVPPDATTGRHRIKLRFSFRHHVVARDHRTIRVA